MLGTNAVLEEMLAQAELQGANVNSTFNMGGRKINIPKLKLSDADWEILEIFLSRRGASLNLVFIVMLYHFPEKFNYENLMIFMGSGSKKISHMAKEMLTNINAEAGEKERLLFIKDLILELTEISVPA